MNSSLSFEFVCNSHVLSLYSSSNIESCGLSLILYNSALPEFSRSRGWKPSKGGSSCSKQLSLCWKDKVADLNKHLVDEQRESDKGNGDEVVQAGENMMEDDESDKFADLNNHLVDLNIDLNEEQGEQMMEDVKQGEQMMKDVKQGEQMTEDVE
ncbi:hypothetical protein L2E82_44069 [Cichorium intybus]|uniref:Uncharacterized protein n=1 Tax=Cichorium intybus TaxID=13427 RepID=A0ACB8ZQL9_CICIN|nr:hypothetical protein L2E82_44069 [Cichorium intybus]